MWAWRRESDGIRGRTSYRGAAVCASYRGVWLGRTGARSHAVACVPGSQGLVKPPPPAHLHQALITLHRHRFTVNSLQSAAFVLLQGWCRQGKAGEHGIGALVPCSWHRQRRKVISSASSFLLRSVSNMFETTTSSHRANYFRHPSAFSAVNVGYLLHNIHLRIRTVCTVK